MVSNCISVFYLFYYMSFCEFLIPFAGDGHFIATSPSSRRNEMSISERQFRYSEKSLYFDLEIAAGLPVELH